MDKKKMKSFLNADSQPSLCAFSFFFFLNTIVYDNEIIKKSISRIQLNAMAFNTVSTLYPRSLRLENGIPHT